MRSLKRNAPSSQMAVSQWFFQKTTNTVQKWHYFCFLVPAPPLLGYGCSSPQEINRSTQDHKRKWAFLKKISDRPRYGALISEFWGNVDEKIGCGIANKGAKMPPKNCLITVLDSKFNVYFDFAIKHDLTQCFKQVMGVWSWVPKKGKNAWLYLN